MDFPDFVCDEILQLPQMRIVDTDGPQRSHRLEKVLRTRSGVATSSSKDRRNLCLRPFGIVGNIRGIGVKAERPNEAIVRMQIDQPQCRVPIRATYFAFQKLDHKGVPILAHRSLRKSEASAATAEGHHETRLFGRAAPAAHLHAEGAVPAEGLGSTLFGSVSGRFPNQRAIGEHPNRGSIKFCKNLAGPAVKIGIRETDKVGVRGRCRNVTVAQCNKIRCQGHCATMRSFD